MTRILIIEDEEILLDILSKKMENEGFEVIRASDGWEGFEKIKKERPDLIMLDMLVPKMDGYQVLESMQRENIKIATIIISNSGQPVDIGRAIKLGACDYLVKAELDPEDIVEKAKRYIINKTAPEDMPRVLLMEDEEFLSQLCAKKLIEAGFAVDTANDGIIGLKKIMENKPDLLLLDIIMPGMTGFDVLKNIRESQDEKIKKMPVIVLSNLSQESDIAKGHALGANDFLVKANFTTDQIVEIVKKNLAAAKGN